ncbi:MAG: molybdenum cofactor guanylyltransferase [Thermomicrobiales bacterium]
MTIDRPADAGLSAAVLAGGASRRMGVDKALLRLAGKTLLQRAISAVSEAADDVRVIGDREEYHHFGVPVEPDLYPGTGPLGGIATALRRARHKHVLVVACDMPFLSVELMTAMAAVPRGYHALVPVTDTPRSSHGGERTYETLHAIYRTSCVDLIELRIASGQLKAFEMLAEMVVHELPEGWLRRYDPELSSLVNANDPDEWLAATARLGDNLTTVEDRE